MKSFLKNNMVISMTNSSEYKKLIKENEKLQKKVVQLERGTTPSKYEQTVKANNNYKERNKNLTATNKELEKENKRLKKEKDSLKCETEYYKQNAHISIIENSFDNKDIPPLTHYVFDQLWELINNYPDTNYVKESLKKWIKEYKDNILTGYEKKIYENWWNIIVPAQVRMEYRLQVTKIDLDIPYHRETCREVINEFLNTKNKYNKIKYNVLNNWFKNPKETERIYEAISLKQNFTKEWEKEVIDKIDTSDSIDYGNNQNETEINKIINEMEKCFNFVTNTASFNEFKVICEYIEHGAGGKDATISLITKALEKKLYLSYDNGTGKCYISNGHGGFQEFNETNNNNIFKNIKKGCYQMPKDVFDPLKAKPIRWISRETLFEKVPLFIEQSITPNKNLIGFDNGFIEIKKVTNPNNIEISIPDSKYPRLPLRQIKTMYLNEEIPDNAMKDIFEQCFTEKDRKIILCYLGFCIYEQGFIDHQELLYIMGLNSIGKTSLIKIITSIFERVQSVDANKISNERQFGLSQFAYADVVIIDELTNASADFNEKMKLIASGMDLPFEEKFKQNSAIPAEYVPRIWLSGNRYEQDLYNSAVGGGVTRRILPIIPIKSFLELDYSKEDWQKEECKEWLVQQATKEYFDLILNNDGNIIGEGKLITLDEIDERLKKLTYPERVMLREHFELVITDYGLDENKYVYSIDLFEFINEEMKKKMLEPSIKNNMQGWTTEIQEAFDYHDDLTKQINGKIAIIGISPITDEAKKLIKDNETKEDKSE